MFMLMLIDTCVLSPSQRRLSLVDGGGVNADTWPPKIPRISDDLGLNPEQDIYTIPFEAQWTFSEKAQ